jgi:hypothetical protein
MSNPVEPEKPDLAAQAEAVRQEYPALAPVLTALANEIAKIGALNSRVLLLERKLEAYLASRPTAPNNPFTSD